jgi:hypothetical protein
MTSAHSILAQRTENSNTQRRRFTLSAWAAIPWKKVGENRIPKQGWVQITETIPQEAKEIMEKKEAPKPKKIAPVIKPIEELSGKELLDYVAANNIEIENADSLTKSQLINEIRKISTLS